MKFAIQMKYKNIVSFAQNVSHNSIKGACIDMWKIQKGYDMVSKTFRLPDEMIEQLGRLACENNLSLNQLVIQCLNFALKNLDSEETDNKKAKTLYSLE